MPNSARSFLSRIRANAPRPRDTRPSAWKRGYDSEWKAIRASYLQSHRTCELCRKRAAVCVDHKKPKAMGGTNETQNLQASCWPCHSSKTAKQDGGFGNRRKF